MSKTKASNDLILPLVEQLKNARVLTIGDIMLDRYIKGTVDRISPEAPIPVLHIKNEKVMLGGSGNVAANVAALGASGAIVSVLGDDGAGVEITRLVRKLGTIDFLSATVPGRATTIKSRFVAGTQQMMRADIEDASPLDKNAENEIISRVKSVIKNFGAVVLSDYGKGVLSENVISQIVKMAAKAKVTVIADPKGRDYSRYRGVDIITPNKKELSEATGMTVNSDDEVIKAARSLIKSAGVGAVLATRSEKGMTLVSAKGTPVHLKAESLDVYDVSGAGDTVVAVLALGIANGNSAEQAAKLANIAAGIVVGKSGTATATTSEMIHAIHKRELGVAEAKVMNAEEMGLRISSWRDAGLSVGFTNGCFDLLHPGHVSLLSEARAQCDRLVVGLNSDSSVKKLKGKDRPIQGETSRAQVLGAMSAVDGIVIFSEQTPLKLIKTFKPDVLIKGSDYSKDAVVGADVVEGYGGKVYLAKIKKGHSTTGTVKKMNGK